MDSGRGAKRRRLSDESDVLRNASISPPPKRFASALKQHAGGSTSEFQDIRMGEGLEMLPDSVINVPSTRSIASPVQLNFIEELPAASNVDTVSLGSILGDPMIKECWLFNYLFDMDFVMDHFDPDTRDLIQVRIVHGSWKREDTNGIGIENAAKRYPNVEIIKAYMPEMYGTHHSKMIVLFRHDDLAQVILLTANFIERDWRMSQAIWKTPLLPLQKKGAFPTTSLLPLGSGPRFKNDLLAYYRGYGSKKLQNLILQLQDYDFGEVRGALIASLPGKKTVQSPDPELDTLWGWPGLKRILSRIPSKTVTPSDPNHQSHIVIQVSSVAAVGEKWLNKTFIPTLSTISDAGVSQKDTKKPKNSIVFPTTDEIRRSVDGYGSGSSIHMKVSTPAQTKQLALLKPMLCHWAGDQRPSVNPASTPRASRSSNPAVAAPIHKAHRHRAAPHIKTYIRFSDLSMNTIDWAIMTSANLSTQAWGAAANTDGEVRICSYEIGVVVWPSLWDDDVDDDDGSGAGEKGKAVIVPVFGKDMPGEDESSGKTVVGWRLPYDLPLVPYREDEKPWCASEPCNEPDWMGRVWPGYGK
ncbi:hypothetical protein N7G274_006946 [Stereocaulon virgatum]|uniref:Phospholipase D/nuclease n=1 Tax=Stereocaulon virgatum TaxID=373712 RepID=A0ABR4A612_9LECA